VSRLSITSRSTLFFSGLRFFGRDLSLLRYLSRSLRQIEAVEIYQDFQDSSRIFKISRHNRDFSRLQAQKSWSRTVITLTNSRSRSRQTVKICQKCHVTTEFSVSIETFRTGRWCRDTISISMEISRPSRLTLFWRRDKSRPPRLQYNQF
jgi:hypothetical protein